MIKTFNRIPLPPSTEEHPIVAALLGMESYEYNGIQAVTINMDTKETGPVMKFVLNPVKRKYDIQFKNEKGEWENKAESLHPVISYLITPDPFMLFFIQPKKSSIVLLND